MRKLALAAEIALTYRRARRLLRRSDLPTVLATLRGEAGGGGTLDEREAARLAGAVGRVLRLLPVDSRCLLRSLVLTGLLGRRGAAGDLVIAVRPGEQLGAHAWVELAGRPLLPPAVGDGYERLVTL